MELFTTIDGHEYPMATNLRVAYEVQGQHNHKPYAEVFKDIGNMGVEQQIDILFASFKCANPDVASEGKVKSIDTITKQKFRDYYLDNYNLKDLMDQLQAIVKGIMGEDADTDTEKAAAEEEPSDSADEDDGGN